MPLDEPEHAWRTVRAELERHSPDLAARPSILVATKVESDAARERARALAAATGQPVMPISSATGAGLSQLLRAIVATLPQVEGA